MTTTYEPFNAFDATEHVAAEHPDWTPDRVYAYVRGAWPSLLDPGLEKTRGWIEHFARTRAAYERL